MEYQPHRCVLCKNPMPCNLEGYYFYTIVACEGCLGDEAIGFFNKSPLNSIYYTMVGNRQYELARVLFEQWLQERKAANV